MFPEVFSPTNAHATLERLRQNHPVFGAQNRTLSEEYATWSANMRVQLKGTITRLTIESLFDGPLNLAALLGDPSQLIHVNAAVSDVCERIGEIADLLKKLIDQTSQSQHLPLVIDTNVILEFEPISSIDWAKVMGEPVRLIVPLRVLEELEEARYGNSKRKSQIARDELPRLVKLLEENPGGPTKIGEHDNATIELFDLREEGLRPSWADDEILDFYGMLRQFLQGARLITDDGPLLARAKYRGFAIKRAPDARRRHRGTEPESVN
jgi:hypothetical protein